MMHEKNPTQTLVRLTFLILLIFRIVNTDENPDAEFSTFDKSIEICDKCECSTFSKYFMLNCANRDMQHTISNWPGHQNKTLKATFSHNSIISLEKFPESNCTASVTIDHCGIKYLAPGLFENMKNIEYVDLSYNFITVDQLSSEIFKGPFNTDENEPIELTHLNLAYNKIHTLPKSLFEHTPKLKHLNLEGNQFRILDLQTQTALTTTPNLEYLNLGSNALKELPDQIFSGLRKLTALDLSNNDLMEVPEILNNAQFLQVLILDSNPINELNDGLFNGLSNLLELSLNNLSYVIEVHSNTFASLKKLRKLYMSHNRNFEFLEPDAFGEEVDKKLSIREIYLNNNNLMDIPSVLLNWSQLHVIEFNDNPLICSCNLYNISKMLNTRITSYKAGPYCIGEEEMSYQVFSLDEKVCEDNYHSHYSFLNHAVGRFSLVRIALITISLIALTIVFFTMIVAYTRYRKYGFSPSSTQFSRSTSVLYNQLDNRLSL